MRSVSAVPWLPPDLSLRARLEADFSERGQVKPADARRCYTPGCEERRLRTFLVDSKTQFRSISVDRGWA